ncbi:hypothetical protein [Paenibacillus periandrae]|uniref:hypothetical protein n=1 Tax=Paenibacillus periandrae TaxID=1761741 RepID=UPI001F09F90E|nr:hypothetical protein [Paenibacillus periandrae]
MYKVVSEQAYLDHTEDIRRGMFRDIHIDFETACGYYDWLQGQKAEMEREKAEAAEQKKNTRPARRMYLRAYLKLLTQSIAHNVSKKKGAAQDAP